MIATDRKAHWQDVYATKSETSVSWYQAEPRLSLELIRGVAPARGCRILDVGGGASVLVDRLLELDVGEIAVLDISEIALGRAKARLGERARRARWVLGDLTEAPELGRFDVWHDRAMFHFLTDPDDRGRYVELARRTVPPGGHLIIATFAEDGPRRCSQLEVCRYNAASLACELGTGFTLTRAARETHTTPWGSAQPFVYGVFRRR